MRSHLTGEASQATNVISFKIDKTNWGGFCCTGGLSTGCASNKCKAFSSSPHSADRIKFLSV